MKLWAMPCRATQDGRVMVETFDKTWSTREGNGKPLQYSWLENPMNTLKRQKDRTLKDELPRLVGTQYAPGEEWKILKEMGIPDHLTCLLRNLYAGQEAAVRTGHGTTDWFQIGKGVHKSCILSPSLFNFYAEYIMRNTGLDETQARIKIAGRKINNLRYADDTILRAKVKKNWRASWWKWKRRVKILA